MYLSWRTFLIFLALIATLAGCDRNGGGSDLFIDSVKSPISTVTGIACPVLEDELVRTSAKEEFSACDLKKNSQFFDGKFVRVRSGYAFMIHGSFLTETAVCPGVSNSVHEAVSVGFRAKEEYDYVDRLRVMPVDITAVGRFTLVEPSEKSDMIRDTTRFRFEVICLERAEVPPNFRGDY